MRHTSNGRRRVVSVLVVAVFLPQIVFGLLAGSAAFSPEQPSAMSTVHAPADQVSATIRIPLAPTEPSARSSQSRDGTESSSPDPTRVLVSFIDDSSPPAESAVAEEELLISMIHERAATVTIESLAATTTATGDDQVAAEVTSVETTQLAALPVELFIDDVEVSSVRQPYVPEPAVLSLDLAAAPIRVFPVVGGGRFSSSFGAPRSEGRTHQGNDIFAEKMTPVIAVASGTVVVATREPGEKCCFVKIRHEDGSHTLYVHLNNDTQGSDDGLGYGIAEGIAKGVRVEAGDLIGYVGDSGNAEETSSHLHFEYHPPGSDAIDPHQLLRGAPVLADMNAPSPIVAAETEQLPFTGPASMWLVYVATLLVIFGVAALVLARRLDCPFCEGLCGPPQHEPSQNGVRWLRPAPGCPLPS